MEYRVGLDIKLISQILGITINALAEKINTTPETLSRIINGKIEPSSKMIESIYSFAYDSGLKINEEKVSYYSKRCNVLLFHGSRNEIKGGLSLSHSRDTVDFGTGFYTGDNYLQSLDFVSHFKNSAIYLFEYEPSELKILNVDVSLEWMLYILYNRKMLTGYENTKLYKKIAKYCDGYDVVVAPIADNRMFSTIESFFKAEITTEQAFHTLNALRLGKQIVFKTDKSLKHLKMLEKLYISKPERESSIKRKIDIVEKTESEIRDINLNTCVKDYIYRSFLKMKKINDVNRTMLCNLQANLFEHYRKYCNCSPSVFVRRFMLSDLAKRFDDKTVLLEISSEKTFVDEINAQYGITHRGQNETVSAEALFWTGYIYRYWSYVYGVPSKLLVQYVSPKALFNRYYVYHSMDLDYAIERICEEENILLHPNKTIEEILEDLIADCSKK